MGLSQSTRLVLYAMPDTQKPDGHPFLVGHTSVKNRKGRYVLNGEFMSFGLFWPNSLFKDRKALAEGIGIAILDQLGL